MAILVIIKSKLPLEDQEKTIFTCPFELLLFEEYHLDYAIRSLGINILEIDLTFVVSTSIL